MAKEFKERTNSVTKRMTVKDDILECHSTMLGYPVRFTITEELREFLRSI